MHHSFSDVLFPMTTIDYLEQTYKEMSENNGVSTISLRSGEPNVSFTKLRVVTKRFLVLRTVVVSGVLRTLVSLIFCILIQKIKRHVIRTANWVTKKIKTWETVTNWNQRFKKGSQWCISEHFTIEQFKSVKHVWDHCHSSRSIEHVPADRVYKCSTWACQSSGMVSNALGESQCKDFFQPLVASTPVKEPATCIDLDDSDSDVDCIETPPKRRPLFPNEPRGVNLDGTSSSKPSLSSFCSADTPVKTDARREPVWINHLDSSTNETADEPFSVQGSETFKLSCRN